MKKKEYKIIIEQGEDGYFCANVPALPCCHTQAKDLKTLNKRLKEVIQLCEEEYAVSPSYRETVNTLGYNPIFLAMQTLTI